MWGWGGSGRGKYAQLTGFPEIGNLRERTDFRDFAEGEMRPTDLTVAPKGSRWHVWLLGGTSVVLAATVLLLSAANTQLEEVVKYWKRQAQWPAEASGFPMLDTYHLDGTPQRVGALPKNAPTSSRQAALHIGAP